MSPTKIGRHHGLSLMEMTVAMSVGAAVLAMAIVTLARFMDMRQSGQDHLQFQTVLGRLAEQFRSDVWEASRLTEAAAQPLALTLEGEAGRRTEYKFADRLLQRTVFQGAEVTHRDAFELPAEPRFEIDKSAARPRITLFVALSAPKSASDEEPRQRDVPICATLARDHRFAVSEKNSKEIP